MLAKGNGQRARRLFRRETEIGRELDRLVDAIAKGRGDVNSLLAQIDGLEKERRDTKAAIVTSGAELITIPRRLVAKVIVDTQPGGHGFSVEVKGRLAELAGYTAFPSRSKGGLMVAGEGLEPPTPGL